MNTITEEIAIFITMENFAESILRLSYRSDYMLFNDAVPESERNCEDEEYFAIYVKVNSDNSIKSFEYAQLCKYKLTYDNERMLDFISCEVENFFAYLQDCNLTLNSSTTYLESSCLNPNELIAV
jgi:hypothetical protein